MLSLISQLVNVDERSKIAKQLATQLGADNVYLLMYDDEQQAYLPALGLTYTLPETQEWKNFLMSCNASGLCTATIPLSTNDTPHQVTALIHEDKLAVVCTGDGLDETKLATLRKLLPLLSALFHFEQSVDQTSAHIQPTTAAANRTTSQKLEVTRKNLKSALQEKDAEIQERIRSEAALAESEQRFRFMAESLSVMVFTSKPDGELDYISPKWEQYTGLPFDSLRGTGLTAVLHPDDAKTVLQYWNHSYEVGTKIEQEVRLKRADGTYRWHLSRTEPMRNCKGDIIMWVGSSTDIEDVKTNMATKLELEEQTKLLTRQQQDLLELNAAKDEFIRLASHQLRTPATGVKMYIGMLMGGYADEPTGKQMKMLDQAYKSNDRQLQIIDDLLKVATIDAGQVILSKETCDLQKLINDIIDELQHTLASRQQHITFTTPSKPVTAVIDKKFMRMVIENIIDNASKYSAADTTITITLSKDTLNEITITDQGVGIAKKDQSLLFKKFSRVHNAMSISAAGTGLGLYWAKEIITLHGGSIILRSKLGHGSTFIVRIP